MSSIAPKAKDRPRSNRSILLLWGLILCLQAFACLTLRPDGPWDRQRVTMNNWQRYGFFNLKGQYVDQVAPLTPDQVASPPVFRGHNPALFYPTYFFTCLLGSVFWGHLIFCLLAISWLYFGLFWTLGRTESVAVFAFTASFAALHGFASLDPVPVSILLFAPLCVRCTNSLSHEGRCRATLLAATCLACFLNWTTALVIALCGGVWLLTIFQRGLTSLRYYLPVGICSGVAVLLAVADKSGQMTYPLKDYFFTNTGYGSGLTWPSAFSKQAVAAFLFNATVWLAFPAAIIGCVKKRRAPWLRIAASLLGGVALCLLLRNYVAHAPLIVAAPLLFVTILLVYTSLIREKPSFLSGPTSTWERSWRVIVVAASISLSLALCLLNAGRNQPLQTVRNALSHLAQPGDVVGILIDPTKTKEAIFLPNYLSRLLGHEVRMIRSETDMFLGENSRLLLLADSDETLTKWQVPSTRAIRLNVFAWPFTKYIPLRLGSGDPLSKLIYVVPPQPSDAQPSDP